MIVRFAVPVLVAVLGAALGWSALLHRENRQLIRQIASLEGQVVGCQARARNITEDKKSDASVADPRTYNVPERWILPEPDAARD